LALGLLMTYVGTPCLYYGSEVGLEGAFFPYRHSKASENGRCHDYLIGSVETIGWRSRQTL
ncbi:MAG: hypothetical protein AAGJ57_04335, partial [Pseudomonadota bacterium]